MLTSIRSVFAFRRFFPAALISALLLLQAPLPASAADPEAAPSPIVLAQASSDDLLSDDSSDDLLSDDSSDDLLSDDSSDDLLSDDTGGDLLSDDADDALLSDDSPADAAEGAAEGGDVAAEAHLSLFAESRYPSANTCKVCHPKQYDEWSVSQHAYAQLSPIYMALQRAINGLTSNTNGDFCVRCHTQVGMNMGESTYTENVDRHPTSREGISCVVCHRVAREYGKVSGRMAIDQGDILQPVYGPKGNEELKRVLDNTDQYRVVTDPDQAGRKIHADVGHFPQLSESAFCGTCHDVNLYNGFRLEEAFSEYKNSPAAKRGVSCQDCHMGKVQGVVSGYEEGPAAVVGGVPTEPRKLTDHFFAGPDYPVVHPGFFPHYAEAAEMASIEDWLQFDYEAGWGTDEFEDNVTADYEFPDRWWSIDDRYDARALLERQFELREIAYQKRLEVLRKGYLLGDIETKHASVDKGIKFRVQVSNGTDGHSVPTGFDGERLVWLEVTVRDPAGDVVLRSGDLDPNGDVRDTHSKYVHNGDLPLDKQLFSLQSRFVVRNAFGGEREQVLPVNYSFDPLPFVRPFTRSLVLTGQPDGARKHHQTIPPLASRWPTYRVKASALSGPGEYTATIRLKSAAVPVNLIDAIKGVGFDYGMSAKEVADEIVAGHALIWERDITFDVQ